MEIALWIVCFVCLGGLWLEGRRTRTSPRDDGAFSVTDGFRLAAFMIGSGAATMAIAWPAL